MILITSKLQLGRWILYERRFLKKTNVTLKIENYHSISWHGLLKQIALATIYSFSISSKKGKKLQENVGLQAG